MRQPPAPPAARREQRRSPRFEVFATVELHRDADTLVLPVKDISAGGIFLTADSHDLAGFVVGSEHELTVFDAADSSVPVVKLPARVVRHAEGGMGLEWSRKAVRLDLLLGQLKRR